MSMDALRRVATNPRWTFSTLLAAGFVCQISPARAAVFRTPNFVVTAPTASMARQVGQSAEKWRDRLAVEWLGKKMPQWYRPCTVRVKVGQIGSGGATTFSFDKGHVFGWNMRVQGTLERILDSVIPHEVSHTIFATHFRRPLPRWADEGAATLVEHETEKRVQHLRLKQAMQIRRHIPLRKLLPMKEYPRDMKRMLLLYAEGFSLADFLVQNGGKRRYLNFLDAAYRNGWDRAVKSHYGVSSVETLEKRWKGWFMAGSPRLDLDEKRNIASREKKTGRTAVVIRSQTPGDGRRSPIAPDPRKSGRNHSTSSPHRETSIIDGRLRALNAGWVPIKRTPAPFPTLSKWGNQNSKSASSNSLRDGSPAGSQRLPVASPFAGMSRSPRDRGSNWSSFPAGRSLDRP